MQGGRDVARITVDEENKRVGDAGACVQSTQLQRTCMQAIISRGDFWLLLPGDRKLTNVDDERTKLKRSILQVAVKSP